MRLGDIVGAVELITTAKNPVALARAVMENSEHVCLAGSAAEKFGKSLNNASIEFANATYFRTEKRLRQLQRAIEENRMVLDHDLPTPKADTKGTDNRDMPTPKADTKGTNNRDMPTAKAGTKETNNRDMTTPKADTKEKNNRDMPTQKADTKGTEKHNDMPTPKADTNETYNRLDTAGGIAASCPEAFGTVGAVALDRHGNLATATSTGGLTNKAAGRIGDTPSIGAGFYADNSTCAVSCTGMGDYFLRACTAHEIHMRMKLTNDTLKEACDQAMVTVGELQGEGGVIAVDRYGNIAMPMNSAGMYRGYVRGNGAPKLGIYQSDMV